MLLTVLNSVNVAAAAFVEKMREKIPFLVITFINCKLNFRRCNYLIFQNLNFVVASVSVDANL